VLHEADQPFLLAEMRTPRLQIDSSSIWCTAWRLHAGLLMKQVRFPMTHHSLAEIVLAPCIADLFVRHFQLVQSLLTCEMCLQHASVHVHWHVYWNLAHTSLNEGFTLYRHNVMPCAKADAYIMQFRGQAECETEPAE